jgi:hypothetical protein
MRLLFLSLAGTLLLQSPGVFAQEPDLPVDAASGLVMMEGWELVQAHCGACHSLKLVTQNRGDRKHWLKMIRWMQDQQNLWPLGPAEETILDYLAMYYDAPDLAPRRKLLVTTWHSAKEEE